MTLMSELARGKNEPLALVDGGPFGGGGNLEIFLDQLHDVAFLRHFKRNFGDGMAMDGRGTRGAGFDECVAAVRRLSIHVGPIGGRVGPIGRIKIGW